MNKELFDLFTRFTSNMKYEMIWINQVNQTRISKLEEEDLHRMIENNEIKKIVSIGELDKDTKQYKPNENLLSELRSKLVRIYN